MASQPCSGFHHGPVASSPGIVCREFSTGTVSKYITAEHTAGRPPLPPSAASMGGHPSSARACKRGRHEHIREVGETHLRSAECAIRNS